MKMLDNLVNFIYQTAKHDVPLLNEIQLEYHIYKQWEHKYGELINQTRQKFAENNKTKNGTEVSLSELKQALLLQRKIIEEKKIRMQTEHTLFLSIIATPVISIVLLFSTFWFNILNEWLTGSVEDAIAGAINENLTPDAIFMNEIRDIVFYTQSRILIILLIGVTVFASLIGFFLKKCNDYKFDPKRNGFYIQYIEDCIKIIEDNENNKKGLWENIIDKIFGIHK